MMTVNQYHARGPFVDTLLEVVSLDDLICLLLFSAALAAASVGYGGGSVTAADVLLPVAYNLGAIVLGFLCGLLIAPFLKKRSRDNRLIIVVAALALITGVCAIFDVSPLLSCMVFGATYINLAQDKELYRQLNHFTPPIMALFFILSGWNLNLSALATAGLIGLVYFAVRIAGKYCGCYFGCLLMKKSVPRRIRNNLGLALVPQAGVAIGLCFLGQRILPAELGDLLVAVILSSSVLYELVGPILAKAAIFRSGAVEEGRRPNGEMPAAETVEIREGYESAQDGGSSPFPRRNRLLRRARKSAPPASRCKERDQGQNDRGKSPMRRERNAPVRDERGMGRRF